MPSTLKWWLAEGLRLLANRLDPPRFVWSSQSPLSAEEIEELKRKWTERYG